MTLKTAIICDIMYNNYYYAKVSAFIEIHGIREEKRGENENNTCVKITEKAGDP